MRLQFVIKEYIEPQYLKAHIICKIIRLAGFIVMTQVRLNRADCFDNYFVDIVPKFINIVSFLAKLIKDNIYSSLMTDIHFGFVLIEDKVWIIFVNRIVCKMHTHIF